MKIKMHAGTLDRAMATVEEIDPSKDGIACYLSGRGLGASEELSGRISLAEYGFDRRIGWHAWLVTVEGLGVMAMTDGPIRS